MNGPGYADFEKLRELKEGWDSYGGKPIDPACIAKAKDLYFQMYGDWSVVPCSDGSVQLEQHKDGLDIEVLISKAASRRD